MKIEDLKHTDDLVVMAYGGGTNSTAMLVGLKNFGIRPDLILFADTGAEKPHTYEHIQLINFWLRLHNFPEITIVRKRGRVYVNETLEEECLRTKCLPSIAYGYKTCSQKYKGQPQEMFVNNWEPAKNAWKFGRKVIKFIGYDADEQRRAKSFSDNKYEVLYPLIEWDWGRDECIEAIKNEGLPLPGKSACFFCPSSKKAEIIELSRTYPGLFQRALNIERNSDLTSIKGLGRNFSWESYMKSSGNESNVESNIEIDCGCYDGE